MTDDGDLLHGWAAMMLSQLNYAPEGINYRIPWNEPPNDRIFHCNLHEFVNLALRGPHVATTGHASRE
jgi:hypothetical protein